MIPSLIFLSFAIYLAPVSAQMECSTVGMDGMCNMDCTKDHLAHLPMCVTHHYNKGQIDNDGIYMSLLSKAENAVALHKQGNTVAAINILNSFINELQAQKGKHIDVSIADMLIHHAQMTIKQIF